MNVPESRFPDRAAEPEPDDNEGEQLGDSDLLQIGGVLLAALLGLLVIGWLMVTR